MAVDRRVPRRDPHIEFHRAHQDPEPDQEPAHLEPRMLSASFSVCIPLLLQTLREDMQIWERARFYRFDPIHLDRDGLRSGSCQDPGQEGWTGTQRPGHMIAPRLIHAARGQHGRSIEFTCSAIERAIDEGCTHLTIEHFATAYATARTSVPNTTRSSPTTGIK